MTLQELETIISNKINKGFEQLIEGLNLRTTQMLLHSAFEKQRMSSLKGDMPMPHSVFREFLRTILPITINDNVQEGDFVGIAKDEAGDLYTKAISSLFFLRGLSVRDSFQVKEDIEKETTSRLDGGLVYIESEKAFYYAKMDAEIVDLELLDEDDIYLVGEYTVRKRLALEDMPKEFDVFIAGERYEVVDGELQKMTSVKDLEARIAVLENKVSELENAKTE